MGLLDGLAGNLLGSLLGGNNAAGGQGQSNLVAVGLQLLQQVGGIPGLLERFKQAGLGDHVASWISTGANQPVSGSQVQEALGPELLSKLAGQAGMDPTALSHSLSQLLPGLVDKLTPEGQVPENHHDLISEGLSALFR
jgi:uncharacterized protein YidB (DUF937 family)